MPRQRSTTNSAALVACVALVTACGPTDPAGTDLAQTDLEQRLEEMYEPDDPEDTLTAACQGGLRAEDDATRDCTVTTGDDEVGVRARVTDVEADDLGIETTPFLPPESVEDAITSSLEVQGYTDVETVCDGELIGLTGEAIVCQVTTPEGRTKVNVDVTSVEGLLVNFDFKGE